MKRLIKISLELIILITAVISLSFPAFAEDFSYTGGVQTFTAPCDGTYQLEVWGAEGSNGGGYISGIPGGGGLGGYAKGEKALTAGEQIYIYVGGIGSYIYGGWNGGGNGGKWLFADPITLVGYGSGGGGGTDIRYGGTELSNRIIVAGGGGGRYTGGAGGGSSGGDCGTASGGTQTSGTLGKGQDGLDVSDDSNTPPQYGGGGGYRGGSCEAYTSKGFSYEGTNYYLPKGGGGGGGSGYIGGVSNGSMQSGVRSGSGYAKITLLAPANATTPTVTTDSVTGITANSATAGGNVTADGGAAITERGVVYSISANPTTSDSKATVSGTTGAFSVNLTGLTADKNYHVRAYATNSQGTSYGSDVKFKTPVALTIPNQPVLTQNMTAVKWDGNSWGNANEANPGNSWYDYSVGSKKWANAKTNDGSMFVWIPRFTYRITYTDPTDRSKGGTVDIKFSNGTTDDTSDDFVKEPAFTFGNEELTGFWVAKFEASDNGRTSGSATGNGTMQILPGKYPNWRFAQLSGVGAMFDKCRSFASVQSLGASADSHLMKNSEWGAVAFLTQAIGTLPGADTNSGIDFAGITGNSLDVSKVYGIYVNTSTTNNQYGIYDMSKNCVGEIVASYVTDFSSHVTPLEMSLITSLVNADGKYKDVVNSSYSTNPANWSTKGMAIEETPGWYSANSAGSSAQDIIFLRGNNMYNTNNGGIFGLDYDEAFGDASASGNDLSPFRPTIAVVEGSPITLTITNPTANQTIDASGTVTITGTITDAAAGKTDTISATIGGVTKTTTVATPANNANWTLTWSGSELAVGTYSSIPVTANDGIGGTATAMYTGTITVNPTTTIPTSGILRINSGNAYTLDRNVRLSINASTVFPGLESSLPSGPHIKNVSSHDKMYISETGGTNTGWIDYDTSKTWQLSAGEGQKTLSVKFKIDYSYEQKEGSVWVAHTDSTPETSFSSASIIYGTAKSNEFTDKVTAANDYVSDDNNKYFNNSEVVNKITIQPTNTSGVNVDNYQLAINADADNNSKVSIDYIEILRISYENASGTEVYATTTTDKQNGQSRTIDIGGSITGNQKPGFNKVVVYFKYKFRNNGSLTSDAEKQLKNVVTITASSGVSTQTITKNNTIYLRGSATQLQ